MNLLLPPPMMRQKWIGSRPLSFKFVPPFESKSFLSPRKIIKKKKLSLLHYWIYCKFNFTCNVVSSIPAAVAAQPPLRFDQNSSSQLTERLGELGLQHYSGKSFFYCHIFMCL